MKRIKRTIITAAALFMSLAFAGGMKASAANYSLNVNEEKEFSCEGETPSTIEFKAPAKGGFHVEVVLTDTIANGKSVNSLNVCLTTKMTYDYKAIWRNPGSNRDAGWVKSPEFCLPAYATVSLTMNGNFKDTTFKFKVKVVNDGDKFFEKENNNTAKKATSIKVKKTYSGVLNDNEDVDWFVFKAPSAGKYKFTAANTEDHHGWIGFTGYKTKNKADGNYVGIYNESGFKKIKTVSLKKGQKYYIKVARSYNSNATYKLKVKKVK